mmetsp:Transcript_61183/g.171150  ORF Transcript_61183/g.171150 Transcript_61183/m.171150 type:complete len:214 (-) Transcript_61183:148-789(-)
MNMVQSDNFWKEAVVREKRIASTEAPCVPDHLRALTPRQMMTDAAARSLEAMVSRNRAFSAQRASTPRSAAPLVAAGPLAVAFNPATGVPLGPRTTSRPVNLRRNSGVVADEVFTGAPPTSRPRSRMGVAPNRLIPRLDVAELATLQVTPKGSSEFEVIPQRSEHRDHMGNVILSPGRRTKLPNDPSWVGHLESSTRPPFHEVEAAGGLASSW